MSRVEAAVVTGGASGLGRATVEALVSRGYRVLALDLAADRMPPLTGVEAVAVDVTDGAAMEAAFARLGDVPLRCAVACAGVAPARRLVGRHGLHDTETFARTLAINVTGTFHLLRLAAGRMAAAAPAEDGARGVIVVTASIAAEDGQIGQCAYAASKGAVWSMVLPAARELASLGIRVVGIAPGAFATPMLAAMPDSVRGSLAATVPFPQRLGAPGEFAALMLHILDNAYLNGTVVRLDGALRMGA